MESKSGFLEHLEELRHRLITVLLALAFFSILAYPLSDDVILRVKDDVLGEYAGNVITTTPAEAVVVRLKLSLLLGAFITVPLLIYETLKFTAPGLYSRERKWVTVTLAGSFILFVAGVFFAYLILLPIMIKFLLAFSTPIAQPLLMLDKTLSFIITLSALMGLVFQWPLVACVLARLGVLSPQTLAARRRHAIVACFLLSAVITDPTFITQIILAVPMIALYEVGIIAAKTMGKKKNRIIK